MDNVLEKEIFEYNPSKFMFEHNKWERLYFSRSRNNPTLERIYSSGLILGKLVRRNDEAYQKIKNKDLISFEALFFRLINKCTEFINVAEKNNSTDLGGEIEFFSTVYDLLIPDLATENVECDLDKEAEVLANVLENVMQRVMLVKIWNDVHLFEWKLEGDEDQIHISPTNLDYEFGRCIATERMHSTLKQVMWQTGQEYRASGKLELLYPFKKIPSSVCLVDGVKEFEYCKPSEELAAKILSLTIQGPFYLRSIVMKPLTVLNGATVHDVIGFWTFLDAVSHCLLASIAYFKRPGTKLYSQVFSFDFDELVDDISECIDLERDKIAALISTFTKVPDDNFEIWLKPLVKYNGKLWLHAPFAISSSFSRVIDYLVTLDDNSEKLIDKGKLFEKEVYTELKEQIKNNKMINFDTEVICYSYKPPGAENEELDVILRLGKSFLIIEAKSYKFSTEVRKYTNNLSRMNKSDLKRKIKVFIREINHFKSKHNLNFDFEVSEDNVIGCYLSSVPHAVGTFVNQYPVIDMSILERYFGNGNFLYSVEGAKCSKDLKEFNFYNNIEEAEINLARYLKSPPQLEKFKGSFNLHDYPLNMKGFSGMKLSVSLPGMNISDKQELIFSRKCHELANLWSSE